MKTLIAVGGVALSGKTTIAQALSGRLGFHHLDIDKIRIEIFGWEHISRPNPDITDLSSLLGSIDDVRERHASYYMLLAFAEAFLEEGASVIVSANFRKEKYVNRLQEIAAKTESCLKLIHCRPPIENQEEMERRIKNKPFGESYNVQLAITYKQYLWALCRQEEFRIPHLTIVTSKPLDVCEIEALNYIGSY